MARGWVEDDDDDDAASVSPLSSLLVHFPPPEKDAPTLHRGRGKAVTAQRERIKTPNSLESRMFFVFFLMIAVER